MAFVATEKFTPIAVDRRHLGEALEKSPSLKYFTPNTFWRSRHPRKLAERLMVLNALQVDSDTADALELLVQIEREGLPVPWAIIPTSPGRCHALWLIHPVAATKKNVALHRRVLEELARRLGGDFQAARADVYVRIPIRPAFMAAEWVEHELEHFAALLGVSEPLPKPRRKKPFRRSDKGLHPLKQKYLNFLRQGRIPRGFRNRAAFNLALAHYEAGDSMETAMLELTRWNEKLEEPLPSRELEHTVRSAYSGRYAGVSLKHLRELVEAIKAGLPQGKDRPRRGKVGRPEKAGDVVEELRKVLAAEGKLVIRSRVEAARQLGICKDTLTTAIRKLLNAGEVVLVSKKLGRGKGAVTYVYSREYLQRGKIADEKSATHKDIYRPLTSPTQDTGSSSVQNGSVVRDTKENSPSQDTSFVQNTPAGLRGHAALEEVRRRFRETLALAEREGDPVKAEELANKAQALLLLDIGLSEKLRLAEEVCAEDTPPAALEKAVAGEEGSGEGASGNNLWIGPGHAASWNS